MRPRPSPVRTVLRSRWTWISVGAVVAVLVGVAAAGGWGQVEEQGLPEVPADTEMALGPYDLTVTGWTVSDELLADDLEYSDADAWVVVSLDVTAGPPSSVRWMSDSLEVSGLELTGYPEVVRASDGSRIFTFHPGVQTPALLLLPVATDQVEALADQDSLPVVLSTHTYRGHVLSEEEGWWGAQPRATLQVERDNAVATLEGAG